jgi:hypothetical protein
MKSPHPPKRPPPTPPKDFLTPPPKPGPDGGELEIFRGGAGLPSLVGVTAERPLSHTGRRMGLSQTHSGIRFSLRNTHTPFANATFESVNERLIPNEKSHSGMKSRSEWMIAEVIFLPSIAIPRSNPRDFCPPPDDDLPAQHGGKETVLPPPQALEQAAL